MMRSLAIAALALVAGCKQAGEGADVSEETKTGVDTQKGSAGGFSAGLAADLAKTDVGSAAPTAGSGSSGAPTSGSGSGSAEVAQVGSGSAAQEEPVKSDAGSGSAKAADTKVADTKTADTKVADAKVPTEAPKAPVEMTPEMKAIKISLGPNWERDQVGAGTISLPVNVQSRDVHFTFKFNYGYDDPKAPTEREQYKKYLADTKQLTVSVDRQQGAAWYLEGTDAAGSKAWRVLVTYGGKHLFCGGSSYKDNDLGDIRDEVVASAKKYCETLAL
jgi:hypothetical protein